MHTSQNESTNISWPAVDVEPPPYMGTPRNVKSVNEIEWDKALQPKSYSIFGTYSELRILFLDVNILDSAGKEPFRGDVLIEGIGALQKIGDHPPCQKKFTCLKQDIRPSS
jgi:hypothetical protein